MLLGRASLDAFGHNVGLSERLDHLQRLEPLENGLCDLVSRVAFDLMQQGQSRLTLSERHDGLTAALAKDSVHFPITEPLALVHNLRAIGEFPAPVAKPSRLDWIAAVALTALFLAT